MSDTGGRARADAAREAAERAAAVAAMLEEAENKGWTALERDAVDYLAPDDKQLTEVVEGGHEWARYVGRVKGGGVYLEGGVRRVLWTTEKKALKLLGDKAAAVPKEERLFTLLEWWRQARATRGEGLTVAATVWNDAKVKGALEDRIRARAASDEESGRIKRADHWEILAQLDVDEETIRRLRGDRTVRPDEAKAVAAAEGADDEDRDAKAFREALESAQGRKAAVLLEGSDAPYVGRDDPAATLVIEDVGAGFSYGVVLKGGDVHLEGGLDRQRHTTKKTAEAIVSERVERLLAGKDLRLLVWVRRQLDRAKGEYAAEARVAADPKLRERLDEALRALAETFEAAPPLGVSHARVLREAGVPEETLSRLLAPDARAAVASAAGRAAAVAATAFRARRQTVTEAVDERLAAGYVWVSEELVPYLPADDERIKTTLAEKPDWCSHAVILDDGTLHLEGGVTRSRLVPEKDVPALTEAAAEQIVATGDVYTLLEARWRAQASGGKGRSVAAVLWNDESLLGRLDDGIRARIEAGEATGTIRRGEHLEVIAALGIGDDIVRSLRGERAPSPDAAKAAAAAARSKAEDPDAIAFAEALEAAMGRKDAVLLEGGDAPIVRRDVKAAVLVVERPSPGWSYGVVMKGGDVHLEGGLRRERHTTKKTAEAIVAEQIEALLTEPDLRLLIWLRQRLEKATGEYAAEARIAADPALRERLDEAIRAVADSYVASPPLGGTQARELRAAGVPEATLSGLVDADSRASVSAAEARAAALYQASQKAKPRTVAEAVEDRAGTDMVWVAEDIAPYLAADDERIQGHLLEKPDWCAYAVVLDDGTLHLEGGLTRRRFVRREDVPNLLDDAAMQLIESGTLYALLGLQAEIDAGALPGTLAAFVKADEKWTEVLHRRISELIEDERYHGHVVSEPHKRALASLGLPTKTITLLTR